MFKSFPRQRYKVQPSYLEPEDLLNTNSILHLLILILIEGSCQLSLVVLLTRYKMTERLSLFSPWGAKGAHFNWADFTPDFQDWHRKCSLFWTILILYYIFWASCTEQTAQTSKLEVGIMQNAILWDSLHGINNCGVMFLWLYPHPASRASWTSLRIIPHGTRTPPLDSHWMPVLLSLLIWFTLVSPRCHYCPTDALTLPTVKIQITFSGKVWGVLSSDKFFCFLLWRELKASLQ